MDINLVPVGNKALEDLYKDIFNKCSTKSTGTFLSRPMTIGQGKLLSIEAV